MIEREKSEVVYNMAPKVLWPIWIPTVLLASAVISTVKLVTGKR